MADKFFVYIVECADKTYYTGYSTDIEKRIRDHNTAKVGAHYTKTRRPVVLMHVEAFETLSEALKREHEIKHLRRKDKEKLWIS